MKPHPEQLCIAFAGHKKVASGEVGLVVVKIKKYLEKNNKSSILIFDERTSEPIEIDFRGSIATGAKRLGDLVAQDNEVQRGPGRPKLGVVSREIGLLPRHWDWLALQSGGASVTLRKLVEDAKKKNLKKDLIRQSQNAAYKFMSAVAGDLPHFENALRALYANKSAEFLSMISSWPKDIREHIEKLVEPALNVTHGMKNP